MLAPARGSAAAGIAHRASSTYLRAGPGSANQCELRRIAIHAALGRRVRTGRDGESASDERRGSCCGCRGSGQRNSRTPGVEASPVTTVVASRCWKPLVGNGGTLREAAGETDGTTPLHIAASHGHADAVRLLIRRGADPVAAEVATGDAIPVLRNPSSIVRDCQTARFNGHETYGLPQSWINEFVIAAHFDFEKIKKLHAQCRDLLLTRSTWDEIAVWGRPRHLGPRGHGFIT